MNGAILGKAIAACCIIAAAADAGASVVLARSPAVEARAADAPRIESVGPSPVFGDVEPQPLVLLGAYLSDHAEIVLRDKTHGREYRNRPAMLREAGRVVLMPTLGNRDGWWSVEVINPDGSGSGESPFYVRHSTPAQVAQFRAKAHVLAPSVFRAGMTAGHDPSVLDGPDAKDANATLPSPLPLAPAAVKALPVRGAAGQAPRWVLVSGEQGGQASAVETVLHAPVMSAPPAAQDDGGVEINGGAAAAVSEVAIDGAGAAATPSPAPVQMAQANSLPRPLDSHGGQSPSGGTGAESPVPPLPTLPPLVAGATNPSLATPAPGGVGSSPLVPSSEQRAIGQMGSFAEHAASSTRPMRNSRPVGTHPFTSPVAPSVVPATKVPSSGTMGYQVGAGDGEVTPSAAQAYGQGGAAAAMDQMVRPEVTTAVVVSNRDVNRLACEDDVTDVIWSEERPVKISKSDGSVFVKFLVEKLGDRFTHVTEPVDLHIVCSGTVYTIVLHPQPMDSVTVRLAPPVSKSVHKIVKEWGGLPLEDKVQRLTIMAFKSDVPDGFESKPIVDGDARKRVTLYSRLQDGSVQAVQELSVTGLYEVLAPGTGLKVTEYEVVSSQARELRETDFLAPAFGDEVSVTLDPLRVSAGQPARLIVVSRSVDHGP